LPIYSLSKRELETLRKYIDENLVKGYIRSSTSLVRFAVLFVPKKDGKLRIYVNYRKLNDIIIKNRYTLPLIHEIQNRIRGAKFFTRFDLREAYYKVRMKKGEE
jgi:hypothetical protein